LSEKKGEEKQTNRRSFLKYGAGVVAVGVVAAVGYGAYQMSQAPPPVAPTTATATSFVPTTVTATVPATTAPSAGGLTIISVNDPFVGNLTDVAKAFTQSTGIPVTVSSYPYGDTHAKEVLAAEAQSTSVDIFITDVPWMGEFGEAGYLEALDDRVAASTIAKSFFNDLLPINQAAGSWKGKIYTLYFGPYVNLGFYRKDLLSTASSNIVDIMTKAEQNPITFEDYETVAKYFTNNSKYPNVYGTAMNLASGDAIGQAWFEYIWNVGKGGSYFKGLTPGAPYPAQKPSDAWTPTFSTDESKDVMNWQKEMIKYMAPGALSVDWPARETLFTTGKIFFHYAWTVEISDMLNPATSQVASNVGYILFPKNTASSQYVPPFGGWGIGLNPYGKQKDNSWKFIEYFLGEAHLKFAQATGLACTNADFKDPQIAANAWTPALLKSMQNCYVECRPRIPESEEIISSIGTIDAQQASGAISVDEAAKRMQDFVTTVMLKGGYITK
jgi:multiple sugar transport system substrate-binding protein